MKTWKVGPSTVDVAEDGEPGFGTCSIAGCQEEARWRSSTQGKRCMEHAQTNG